jgi:nucleotide-binding universal stress UspA family protein
MSKIVVGFDGSDTAQAALGKAAELAKGLGDSVVIVFGYAPGGYGGGEVPAQREAVEELGEQVTVKGVEQAKAAGVEYEVEMINEHADHALITEAEKHGARMIVVGSHGESPLKGAVLGSTPYRLVHYSKIPVLVVRP